MNFDLYGFGPALAAGAPVVHTVELLDWATGGPRPRALARPE